MYGKVCTRRSSSLVAARRHDRQASLLFEGPDGVHRRGHSLRAFRVIAARLVTKRGRVVEHLCGRALRGGRKESASEREQRARAERVPKEITPSRHTLCSYNAAATRSVIMSAVLFPDDIEFLQRILCAAGCYQTPFSGVWDPATDAAEQAFFV